ncbi:diacylglycerol kinase family protein [Anaerolinea thermophila]|uniref:diacylglycerol kinase family protein n=2 Tax=Anaerolinea TaxID=233189 RepID=UPI0026283EBD|nr:diacylglycerol kinase family protein [Anaerolinea thermophila]
MMNEFLRLRIRAFGYAFSGWWYVIRTQRNAWIHAIISIVIVVLCLFLNLPARDWAVIILTIALVWISEFLNTALEAVVDLAMPIHHPLARVGKDVGAAAVLISAIAAVLVGIFIIGPALWQKIAPFFAR